MMNEFIHVIHIRVIITLYLKVTVKYSLSALGFSVSTELQIQHQPSLITRTHALQSCYVMILVLSH